MNTEFGNDYEVENRDMPAVISSIVDNSERCIGISETASASSSTVVSAAAASTTMTKEEALLELQNAYDTCTRIFSSMSAMTSDLFKWLPPSSIHCDGCKRALDRVKAMRPHVDKFEGLLFQCDFKNVTVNLIKDVLRDAAPEFQDMESAAEDLSATHAGVNKKRKSMPKPNKPAIGDGNA